MVCGTRTLLRKYGNFIDNLRLYVKGGAGGMGFPRLGGQGGKGGDVWFVAKDGVTLKKLKDKYPHKRFSAGPGTNSSVRALKGEMGQDCEVLVPVGIFVTNDNGKKIGELNKIGDRIRVAGGGHGGSYMSNFLPSKGQSKMVRLDLKLVADIGLVGFPNAGKSSLLNIVSHAKPEIADYPFTTLRPHLGKVMFADHRQISIADLPGLIEGAHVNKGMGHKFLKHVERTKQLLFVVDISGFQLSVKNPFRTAFETIQLLTKELELYKEELLTKPALLAVNKMDLPNSERKWEELMVQLENPKDFLHLLPEEMFPEKTIQFKYILPISASTGKGIEEFKNCIRKSLEEQADFDDKEFHQVKLRKLQAIAAESQIEKFVLEQMPKETL